MFTTALVGRDEDHLARLLGEERLLYFVHDSKALMIPVLDLPTSCKLERRLLQLADLDLSSRPERPAAWMDQLRMPERL